MRLVEEEIRVRKASGEIEAFRKEKVVNTCINLGVRRNAAWKVADEVRSRAYDGITTKEILSLTFEILEKYKPEIRLVRDLREAIAMLPPKPEFEEFARKLLRARGYRVSGSTVLKGACIEHEIDGIAEKDGEVIYLEVKHHQRFHTPTPLEVSLSVWATLEDLKEGFEKGYHRFPFTNALIATNTKFSLHAKLYALCKGLRILSWNFPEGGSFKDVIRKAKLYPTTFLKEVDSGLASRLFEEEGILTLDELSRSRKRSGLAERARLVMKAFGGVKF